MYQTINKKLIFIFFISIFGLKAQVNYVTNGGFEKIDLCMPSFPGPVSSIYDAPPWDTLKSGGGGGYVMHRCQNPNTSSGVPYNLSGGGYQEPHHGDGYSYVVYFKLTPNPAVNWRWYIQQKMASKLVAGKSYCVTYWASLINYVNYGVDELGAYFDDGSIQSIAWSKEAPANPQVKSPTGIFYTDTLNWMKVQDTFIANGTEEYITLGNFRTNAATNYTSLNTYTYGLAAYFIDDVSVIETNLPAYAGPDIFGIPGNTVYLGRPSEIGLDDDCFWYKLPNTTTPIDTAAGITVTVGTTNQTYMVIQDICGVIKYDTVVVYASAVGVENVTLSGVEAWLRVFPNPANSVINVEVSTTLDLTKKYKLEIVNVLGQTIKQQPIEHNNLSIDVKDFNCGVYTILIKTEVGTLSKKVVIEK